MSHPPDFRLERSELRGEDEYTEFGYDDLEYYVDVRGTFDKLPLCPDDQSLSASGADVAIVGAPTDDGTSGRPGARFGPRAIRSAPPTWGRDAWSIQLEVEPYERLIVVDAGDAPVVPSPGIASLMVCDISSGVIESSSPTTTAVGTSIVGRSGRLSGRCAIAMLPCATPSGV